MLKVVVEVESNSQTFFFFFHRSTNRMSFQSFHSRRALLTSPLFQHQLAHFNEVYLLSILVMVDTEMTSFAGTLSNTHKTTPIAQKFGFLRLGVSPTSQPVLSASGLASHAKRQQMFLFKQLFSQRNVRCDLLRQRQDTVPLYKDVQSGSERLSWMVFSGPF